MREVRVKRSLDAFEEYVAARSSALLRTTVLIAGADRELGQRLLDDALAETYQHWTRLQSAAAREPHTRSAILRLALSRRRGSRYAPTAPPPGEHGDTEWLPTYLRDLTARQRAVVVLRYFHDLTVAEAAATLRWSTTTASNEVTAALAILQARLRQRSTGRPGAGARPEEIESRLRRALAHEVDGVGASVASVQSAVRHGDAVVHDTRRRRLWTTGVGSAAAAVVGLASWQLLALDGAGERELEAGRLDTDTYAWAMSLPRGDDARLAYTLGSTLVYGAHRVEVTGAHRLQLESAVQGGWLARAGDAPDGGRRSAIGIVRPSGAFQRLASAPAESSNSTTAVSPDRSLIAYGSHIFNANDGTIAGPLPANLAHLDRWSEAGIAYRDAAMRQWLWRPDGGGPIRVRPLPASPPTPQYGVAGLSPGGQYDVRYGNPEIAVVDTLTGQALVRVPRPAAVAGDFGFGTCCRTFWESDTGLILELSPPAYARAAGTALLVRCSFPSGQCERASELLPEYPFPTAIAAEHRCGQRGFTPAAVREPEPT